MTLLPDADPFERIRQSYRVDESQHVKRLLESIAPYASTLEASQALAIDLIATTRHYFKTQKKFGRHLVQSLDLTTDAGVILMTLAEALPRIPDQANKKQMIADHFKKMNFEPFMQEHAPLIERIGLRLAQFFSNTLKAKEDHTASFFKKLQGSLEKPSLYGALLSMNKVLSNLAENFVMAESLNHALKKLDLENTLYSFDMLGEAALCNADAERYFNNYKEAILFLAKTSLQKAASISVKLSALHPRYEFLKQKTMTPELLLRVQTLARLAAEHQIEFTLDAEESDRLTLSLEIFEALLKDPVIRASNCLGLAVQAYQKRSLDVIDWLKTMAETYKVVIPVRLVKGAYWDTEIKSAQEKGVSGYPVFTRKISTDLSYLSSAISLLRHPELFRPQFATHNAETIAAILSLDECPPNVEFQRLYGMGEELYAAVKARASKPIRCRVYAPIGYYHELLPYLVRRLIENGANSSFVHKLGDEHTPPEELIANVLKSVQSLQTIAHPDIPLPKDIYGPTRPNAEGVDLTCAKTIESIHQALGDLPFITAHSLIKGKDHANDPCSITNPAYIDQSLGHYSDALDHDIDQAIEIALRGFDAWNKTPVDTRASILEAAAHRLEQQKFKFIALLMKEAGKTAADAAGEVREAIDFCRYYAQEGRSLLTSPRAFSGITGENNFLTLEGRGLFICISPWNFPLSIFLGQIAAALVTGHTVVAKPAEQTPLLAYETTRLLLDAGVPREALQLILGDGTVGSQLVASPSIAGVTFTGSFDVAQHINRSLAAKPSAIIPFIAETGGQNAMIVDSSALLEQAVKDIIASSFQSAGQRCSALRVLLLQEEIADETLRMLRGAMDALTIGNPQDLETDVGPLIDETARDAIESSKRLLKSYAKQMYEVPLLDEQKQQGHFTAPAYFEIDQLTSLTREIFGPVLHVYRYQAKDLASVIKTINSLGFGLTGGIHSRITSHIETCAQTLNVGNLYVNRTMIGAVVGVQPFGGHGLSGTGPKAGGPFYLTRFTQEKSFSYNTTAFGGNLTLLSLNPDHK
ncbi:MAG: bifunctional proline dehydrogenase/L-glutamate gamma-semialdehyde dehydrogenase PutA [Candidatus Nucleicultricaceae bacterium]